MAPSSYSSDDKEKGDLSAVDVDQAAPDDSVIADRYARYGRFGPIIQRVLASGVEARGVERVPESERETKNVWNKCVSPLTVQRTPPLNRPGQPLDVVVSRSVA